MQLILLLIVVFVFAWQENVFASNFLSIKSFGYKDSDKVGIWQGLVLYKTDLSDTTSVSLRYGLDAVTSASSIAGVLNGTTSASSNVNGTKTTSQERDDDNEHDSGSVVNSTKEKDDGGGQKLNFRHSGGLSLTHKFTHELTGTTSLDLSYKTDYQSITLGQSFVTPVLDSLTTISGGIFYTKNHNMPLITTTNVNMLPPLGNLDSSFVSGVVGLERILGKTTKIKLLLEPFTRSGYLSSATQFIPITGGVSTSAALEVLPNERKGYAVSAIWSQGLFSGAAMHLRGRYYEDSYGLKAWSSDINYSQNFDDSTILSLKYRYYSQSAVRFWYPTLTTVPSGYFTNHPAMSQFSANEYSVSLRRDLVFFNSPSNINGSVNYYDSSRNFKFLSYTLGYEVEF